MTVSNEDRDAAIAKLATVPCVYGEDWDSADLSPPTRKEAGMLIDALIAAGWGPRRTVSKREIERHIYHAVQSLRLVGQTPQEFDAIVEATADAVLAVGIEVTDDQPA